MVSFNDGILTYALSAEQGQCCHIGSLVSVSVRGKEYLGIISEISSTASFSGEMKAVQHIFPHVSFSTTMLHFLDWVSKYTVNPVSAVCKMALPIAKDSKYLAFLNAPHTINSNNIQKIAFPELTDEQLFAAKQINKYINQYSVHLLDGITGSGKTMVYLYNALTIIKDFTQSQILLLLPEILLATAIVHNIENILGIEVIQWHSGLTLKKRRENWIQIYNGSARIIAGARSALFLPYKNLKLIIIDEEHDSGFKQEDIVTYNARDMAIARAHILNIPIILSSATPSIESLHNAKIGKYHHIKLNSRYGNSILPAIKIIDMKCVQSKTWISSYMYDMLKHTLNNDGKAGIFLNRRGYAPVNICTECGYKISCKYCDVYMVEHRNQKISYLLCHYCGYKIPPQYQCIQCHKKNSFIPYGPGITKVTEEITQKLKDKRIIEINSDILQSHKHSQEIINKIMNGDYDIIIGTQMIAKGHNFPKLRMIGVVDADLIGMGGDLRASERMYQLLHQVSGRAGREDTHGIVALQTYNTDSNMIQALYHHNRDIFYTEEMNSRKNIGMPPFGRLVAIILSGIEKELVIKTGILMKNNAPCIKDIDILGPVPAPIARLQGKYRVRLLIRSPKTINIQKYIRQWLGNIKISPKVKCKIDVDPIHFI